MKLGIPKDHAIQILKARIKDLSSPYFISKSWTDKTVNDLKEIFPRGLEWSQVQFIQFDTFITADKEKVLIKGKATAEQLLESYIERIENYSKINDLHEANQLTKLQIQYNELLKDWNTFVPKYNELLNRTDALADEFDKLVIEKQKIIDSHVPIENLTFESLVKGIHKMPVGKVVGFYSVLLAILIGAFTLGGYFVQFDSKNELMDLKEENSKLEKDIKNSNLIIQQKDKMIDSLVMVKIDPLKSDVDSVKSAK